MDMTAPPILFAGPSLTGVDPELKNGFDIHPPIRRGDINTIVENSSYAGVIIVADGIFHHYPSVGHAEIRRAIDTGWEVWGTSSMGAIRAAEMQSFGMHGFGYVFEKFAADPDFMDDEVALLHLGEPPYISASEPLVHIREFVAAMQHENRMSDPEALHVLQRLKSRWFGDRTMALLATIVEEETCLSKAQIKSELSDFKKYRRKNQDLEQLLRLKPWRKAKTE